MCVDAMSNNVRRSAWWMLVLVCEGQKEALFCDLPKLSLVDNEHDHASSRLSNRVVKGRFAHSSGSVMRSVSREGLQIYLALDG